MSEGTIFNIQRFSVHDGPGIRTTVFLKGCNLRCFWCHNPESWHPHPELQFFPDLCIGCGRCLRACPRGAHESNEEGRVLRRDLCTACGACARTCYAQALVHVGRQVAADEAVAEILKDRAAYDESGGGVTLSGGEPLLQPAFVRDVLEKSKAQGLHTAVETALHVNWRIIEEILPPLDLVMLDLKLMDPGRHRSATGRDNALILANARRLGAAGIPLIVRTPVVPGVNDTAEEIGAIASFVSGLPNVLYWELLPFHRLGEGKSRSLGREFPAAGLQPPGKERMRALLDVAASAGVEVR